MKEYLHLFDKTSESLPPNNNNVLVFNCEVGGECVTGWYSKETGKWITKNQYEPTHWLDLSKLTTILRAENCIKSAYMSGVESASKGYDHEEVKKYLSQL